jgi:hypothetical protein
VTNTQPSAEKLPPWLLPEEELKAAITEMTARCKAADITFDIERDGNGDPTFNIGFKCGRERRVLSIWDQSELAVLLAQEFEDCVFLGGWQAICNYSKGTIEAMLQVPGGAFSPADVFKRLFGVSPRESAAKDAKIILETGNENGPILELSMPSPLMQAVSEYSMSASVSLKITGHKINGHDEAVNFLDKISNSLLFQLDLVSNIPFVIRRKLRPRRRVKRTSVMETPDLRFPTNEFESAPLSLYWYGRSARGMPLLQYLAYYQSIEFYFPRFSQSEAHRKLKSVLKHPSFRGDKDSDVAKLLNAIYISRSGAYGDERAQLRATIDECIQPDDLRRFIREDSDRAAFFSAKTKAAYQKININADDSDLCADVSRRIYEIRCKIVHTKSDFRDQDIELLLPFSKEADQLDFDIELVQYVAQQVLIAGSNSVSRIW